MSRIYNIFQIKTSIFLERALFSFRVHCHVLINIFDLESIQNQHLLTEKLYIREKAIQIAQAKLNDTAI